MYNKVNIDEINKENKLTSTFEMNISFYKGSGDYSETSILIKTEGELLLFANELNKLDSWFLEKDLDSLTDNEKLKEAIEVDIYEIEDNPELRFEGSSSLIIYWFDENGDKANVRLSED